MRNYFTLTNNNFFMKLISYFYRVIYLCGRALVYIGAELVDDLVLALVAVVFFLNGTQIIAVLAVIQFFLAKVTKISVFVQVERLGSRISFK